MFVAKKNKLILMSLGMNRRQAVPLCRYYRPFTIPIGIDEAIKRYFIKIVN